jgi:hypothetical protein
MSGKRIRYVEHMRKKKVRVKDLLQKLNQILKDKGRFDV